MTAANSIPKLYTAEDRAAEQVERWRNGSDRDRALVLLSAFATSARLPVSDDHDKIAREAIGEFQDRNYSGAVEAVESLVQIVDHYKEFAEKYLSELTRLGAVVDEYGDATTEPFAILENGEQVLGKVEVFDIDEVGRDGGTWNYYVKPYLPYASETEREWIARNFPDEINNDTPTTQENN